MSDLEYTYAVARIRSKELSLFSSATIEQLIARKTYESCLQFLQERGGAIPTHLWRRSRF